MRSLKKQQGFLIIVAVMLIVVIGFLGVAMSYVFTGSSRSTTNHALSMQAFYLAESGLENATRELLAPTVSLRSACSGLNISNSAGSGAYTVTATTPVYVSSPTTNVGALSATATTIPVVSSAAYQPSGRIMMDRELINYAAISGNNFIGVQRGVDGTTAAIHNASTSIGQYQCNLSSTGGVPTVASPATPGNPSGKRLVQDSVQLQEAWAVGNNSGSNYTLARWNRPTELAWNNAATSGVNAMNGVSMVSYVDGWAVGAAGNFLHWNGNAWASTTVTPAIIYQSVYCVNGDNCHAVGASSGTLTTIQDWNGTAWTRNTGILGTSLRTNLVGVRCNAANNCWAVGSNTGGGAFYRWNGSTWTGVSVSGLSGFTFNSVFCNSASDCWAVGANATFARYNGTTWANSASGLPSAQYNSVYCNSSSDCWAVGNVNSSRDLIVRWNGTAWSRDASNPTPIANLNEVRCFNASDCWAVGGTSSGSNPAFVHWDGTSWTAFATSGLPSGAILNGLSMVGPSTQPQSAWTENFG